MNIKIAGAHNCESLHTRLTCILIDGVLAIDAGGLTSGLSIADQLKLKAILLTHHHYDHIRDIPALAMNFYLQKAAISVYSTPMVLEALQTHLLNNDIYPDFLVRPPGKPTVRFNILKPLQEVQIEGYAVTPVPVHHALPTVGYQVTAADGKSLFFTGDTGPGLAECWQRISPNLLIIELTGPNSYHANFLASGHLAPASLEQELIEFREIKGYLPEVVTVHMSPFQEKEIETELAEVEQRLGQHIRMAYEGMEIKL